MLDYTNNLVIVTNIKEIKTKVPYLLAVDANVPNAKPSIIDLVGTYVSYVLGGTSVDPLDKLANVSNFLDELEVFQSTNAGYQGYQGYKGTMGVQGPQGSQGPKGAAAPPDAGIQGYTGYQGIQGPKGIQGVQGYQGYQGYIGSPTDTEIRRKVLNILTAQGLLIDSSNHIKVKHVRCTGDIYAAGGFYQR